MSTTSRRGFLGALAVSGATLTASRLAAAPDKLNLAQLKKETDIACLYHCDFGDPQRFSQMLTNINNHMSVYEFDTLRVKIVVVVHWAAELKRIEGEGAGGGYALDEASHQLELWAAQRAFDTARFELDRLPSAHSFEQASAAGDIREF